MDKNDSNIYFYTATVKVIQCFELRLNFLAKFQQNVRLVHSCELQNIIHKWMYLIADFIVNKFEENKVLLVLP